MATATGPPLEVRPTGSERWVRSLGLPSSEGWRPWAAGGVMAGGISEYRAARAAGWPSPWCA